RPLARRGAGAHGGRARSARAHRVRAHRGDAAASWRRGRRRRRQPHRRGRLDSEGKMLIARSVHPLPGEAERKERLMALVDGFSSRRVLVVGDVIADEFIYGQVQRISREAPVLILKYDATEVVAGGAGNAANNVAALGGRARLAGIVGADAEGRRVLASFERGVERRDVVRALAYRTPVKTRILAGGVHSAKQQVVRIDREAGWPVADGVSRGLLSRISRALRECD